MAYYRRSYGRRRSYAPAPAYRPYRRSRRRYHGAGYRTLRRSPAGGRRTGGQARRGYRLTTRRFYYSGRTL